jgi:hypothetical protein
LSSLFQLYSDIANRDVYAQEWGRSFPPERLQAALETNKLARFATVDDVVTQVKTFVVSKSVIGQNAVVDAGFSL